jgi:hypothetical protein
MAKTINDVRAAGYEVSLASGSVEVEEKALAEAKKGLGEKAIEGEAATVALNVAQAAKARDMPDDKIASLVMRATSDAVAAITTARNETVAFHERAVAAAKEMPDVYFVSALGDPETPGDDVQLYVACKSNGSGWDKGQQAILDSLVAAAK